MTFSKADFQYLKWSLLTFLVTLGLGGTAIMTSANFINQADAQQRAAQRQLNEARNQLATAREDRENMQTYALEYGTLLNRNIIGSSQRLDWIEGLDKIHRQSRVLDFKYTIGPQQPYTPAPALGSGNFDINLSSMTLQFDLLHEGQLIRFFDALRANVRGLFMLDRCALERTLASVENNEPNGAQIKAECAGGWLTLKNRNEK